MSKLTKYGSWHTSPGRSRGRGIYDSDSNHPLGHTPSNPPEGMSDADRIELLRKTLAFYADPETYEQVDVLGKCGLSTDRDEQGYGARARAAINGERSVIGMSDTRTAEQMLILHHTPVECGKFCPRCGKPVAEWVEGERCPDADYRPDHAEPPSGGSVRPPSVPIEGGHVIGLGNGGHCIHCGEHTERIRSHGYTCEEFRRQKAVKTS